jgi:3-phenylpropionate/cinnamic acid dioxygenase small subunit
LNSTEDRLEIMDLVARYGAGLDARDWELWRNVFTGNALFDLGSWSGVTAERVETDRVVRAQARVFAELSVTQHMMSNFRIMIEGDGVARVLAVMRAEHWIQVEGGSEETKRYTMFGYYDDRLVKEGGAWKIDEMHLNVTKTEGERWVMKEAERRARAKKLAER